MPDCPYCEEFREGTFIIDGRVIGSRILFESENFVVFPALGQIIEGYLLIVPKMHYLAIGEIPAELYSELEQVQEKVRAALTEKYEIPLFFEHGPASRSRKGGCCIDHAHLHAVPLQAEIFEEIAEQFSYRMIDDFNDLKEQFFSGAPYLFLEKNNQERYVFKVPVIPSQYIRKIIACKIGKPERWDWKLYLGIEEMISTLDRLRNNFK